ncbi:MAG TPA: ABC transporter permease [Gemmatimonadaceae bacterium]|nr:ABC transporter permease [Gemmatimonadaceae bacterium]
MARLWAVVKREYLERVRTKWFIVATVFAPLFFGMITIFPIWLSARSAQRIDVNNILILDASGRGIGKRVQFALGSGPMTERDTGKTQVIELDTSQLAATELAALDAVIKKQRRGYLVIPPTIMSDTVARYAGRNASSLVEIGRISAALRDGILATRLEQEGMNAGRVMQLTSSRRIELSADQIGDKGREGQGGLVKYFFSFTIAFLLYMSIFLYSQNVMRSVLEEKQSRVAEVIVSSVPPDTLLAGKVIGVGAVGITQQLLWIATSVALFYLRAPIFRALRIVNAPISIPSISMPVALLLIVFFILGFLLYSALFASVGAMVNDDREAQQAQQPFTLLLIGTIILVQPLLINPSSDLAVWSSIFPFSAAVLMPLRLSMTSVPGWQLVAAIVSMIVMIVIAIWMASRIYRIGLLMYGKRPTIRELARWVRRSA